MKNRTVFFTRKFPPQKGGMETFSWELTRNFPGNKKVIHHGKRQADIVWLAPLFVIQALWYARSTRLFHLSDLVLAPIAPLIRSLTDTPIVVTVHALELTFDAFGGLYQRLMNWALRSGAIDHYVCVSEYTAQLLRDRGVDPKQIRVITHGVTLPENLPSKKDARTQLHNEFGIDVNRPLLLTIGRLVKRKGVAWFVETVLPRLAEYNPLYIIGSDGPEREQIRAAAQRTGMENNIHFTGFVNTAQLNALYAGCDIWVSPNIPVENDAEGFGFVAIEAAVRGMPVIAADIEGIPSAIHDGKNGLLLEPQNADAFTEKLLYWLEHTEQRTAFAGHAQQYTREHFQWKTVAQEYASLFDYVTHKKSI